MHPSIRAEIMLLSNSFTQSQQHIRYYSTTPFKHTIKMPIEIPSSACLPWTKEHIKKTRAIIYRIRKIKGILQRFVHMWRFKRLVIRNTDDIMTLEPIKQLIQIVDWEQRQIFQFEAQSLMKDITGRLLTHDGIYDSPQLPRNAFTNLHLTLPQMISVWSQLSRSTVSSSWAFTAFRASRWAIDTFENEYAMPIRLHAYRQTFQSMKNADTQDLLQEFARAAHVYHNVEYPEYRFMTMILKKPDIEFLHKWRSLALKHYELAIKYVNNSGRLIMETQRIMSQASKLIIRF